MGKFQTQKLMRPIVLKDAYTYKKQLLLYDFPKFGVRLAASRPPNIEKMAKNFKNLEFS
jgi:hypothetical protein